MPLGDLPVELLLLTTRYLTTPEYSAVRLTCKTLYEATYDSWAQEFFTTRQFSLLLHSLEVLIAISKHSLLQGRLKRLIISSDNVPAPEHLDHILLPLTRQQVANYHDYFANQTYMASTGSDVAMLKDAIRSLPNLSSVEIRNFDSTFEGGRVRDLTSWKSYGWSAFEAATSVQLRKAGSEFADTMQRNLFYTNLFQKVLAAAVECRNLKSLVGHIRQDAKGLRRTDGINGVGFGVPSFARAQYEDRLRQLETLMVNLKWDDDLRTGQLSLELISKFAAMVPNLKHLRLNGQPRGEQLTLAPILEPLTHRLKKLTKFEIGTLSVRDIELQKIPSFRSLCELSLFQVSLEGGAWAQQLPDIVDKMPNLRALTLIRLRQLVVTHESNRMGKVAFKRSPFQYVVDMRDESLTSSMYLTDKREANLSTAIRKAMELMVVDDMAFREARSLLQSPPQSSDGSLDGLGSDDSHDFVLDLDAESE